MVALYLVPCTRRGTGRRESYPINQSIFNDISFNTNSIEYDARRQTFRGGDARRHAATVHVWDGTWESLVSVYRTVCCHTALSCSAAPRGGRGARRSRGPRLRTEPDVRERTGCQRWRGSTGDVRLYRVPYTLFIISRIVRTSLFLKNIIHIDSREHAHID
jgi:hypothetical protein